MAINDVYELTHVQRHVATGELIQSKWYYNGVDLGASAEVLFDGWVAADGMLEAINLLQCDELENVTIRVINLFSLTDFYEDVPPATTFRAGEDCLPIHTALNISLKIDTRGVSPGSKRISGIPESAQVNGAIALGGYITEINALLALIPLNVGSGGVGEFDPIVVKRIREGNGTTVPYSYSLPTNVGETNFGHVVAAVANFRLSHQVSRGNGR